MILLTLSLHDFKLKTSYEKPYLTHDMAFCTVCRRKQKKKNNILQSFEVKQKKNVHLVGCEDIKMQMRTIFFFLAPFLSSYLQHHVGCLLYLLAGHASVYSVTPKFYVLLTMHLYIILYVKPTWCTIYS